MLRFSTVLRCQVKAAATAAAAAAATPAGAKAAGAAAAAADPIAPVVSAHSDDAPLMAESEVPPMPTPSPHQPPAFFFKGRRGTSSSEYYVTRSNIGHPDPVAEMLGAGRTDTEWMWVKFLCFVCFTSTVGTYFYGVFFEDHMRWFKDEPWSRFRY